jgi:hypothetical protein
LRRGEELLFEVPCRIVDSTGTSLPDPGTAVVVGVSDERILVWDVARVPTRPGKLLGVVGRSRLLRAEIERAGARTCVRFGFEEEARLFLEAPRERHPEQLAWVVSADPGHVGQ